MNKENKENIKSNVCSIKDCGRPTHKESKYCIFHAKPEEKEEEEFKKALEKYIKKIKENNLDYDFAGFIFIGKINFEEEFKINNFKDTNFSDATFEGEVDFCDAIFENEAGFCDTTFKDGAIFMGATFEGEAEFWGATFEGGAGFMGVIFEGEAGFWDTTFKCGANFSDATFKGEAGFEGAIFEGDVYFNRATLPPGKILLLKVKNMGNISFMHTFLENIVIKLDLEEEVFIDFRNAILKNTQIEKKEINGHILQEQEKDFSTAKEIYLLLKNNFHSIGRYEDESWAFKKEKDMERKSYFNFKTSHKWLWSCFLNAIYGYGEKPDRVIVSAMVIIIIFAFIFMNFGIDANPRLDTIPKCNILKELFLGVRYGDLLIRLKDISWEQIKNCLYFSTVTFTTLGYGDFHPLEGWSRIFAGTEAFIGAFTIALFVYTFARRTGGR